MILQFQCQNHRSIKDKITLSMLATTDTTFSEKLISVDSKKYLRGVFVYGANGSGKTSILDALYTMKKNIVKSNTYQSSTEISRTPHKSIVDKTTEFCLYFIKNKTLYYYSFEYTNNAIISEKLYYWPEGEESLIFERSNKIIDNEPYFKFNSQFKKIGQNCHGRLKEYNLLLSVSYKETNIPEIQDVFDFFNKDLIFLFPNKRNSWIPYSLEKLESSKELRDEVLAFMHSIGSDIVGLKVDTNEHYLSNEELSRFAPSIRTTLKNQLLIESNLKLTYKDFSLDIQEESQGIKKLFSIICPIIDIIKENKILICDEIETSLHYNIVFEIIRRFFNNTDSISQLICTTHDTELLNLNLFRKDQVWFTELEPVERKTELYSLSDIKNVRKDENIRDGYVMGKYGAIPMINKDIQKLCGE